MSDEKPTGPKALRPTEEDIRVGLLAQYDQISDDGEKAKLFEQIAKRVWSQSQEKLSLQQRLEARESNDIEQFGEMLNRLLLNLESAGCSDMGQPKKLDSAENLAEQLPAWSAVLANAAGFVNERAAEFDGSVNASRKRRRQSEAAASGSPAPPAPTSDTTELTAKTNTQILGSLIV